MAQASGGGMAAVPGLDAKRRRHVGEWGRVDGAMKPKALHHGHCFPAAIISQAVRWYFRFQLSLRDSEELLFERGVIASDKSAVDEHGVELDD